MKFKFERNGQWGWSWTITHADGTTESYKTNKSGEGLWVWDDSRNEYKQIEGTCQFRSDARTDNGMKAYIRRYFRD